MTRNLIEYPIQKQEVLNLLDAVLSHTTDEDSVGDLAAHILTALIKIVDRDFKHEDFNP